MREYNKRLATKHCVYITCAACSHIRVVFGEAHQSPYILFFSTTLKMVFVFPCSHIIFNIINKHLFFLKL